MIRNLLTACLMFAVAGVHAQSVWTKAGAATWYGKYEWLQGLKIKPDPSVDQLEFAREYHQHKKWWDEAFAYLKNTDFSTLAVGNYPIDGEDVYVKVTDGVSKDLDSSRWESHNNYHDIHYHISGKEMVGIIPVKDLTPLTGYDSKNDITFYAGDGPYFLAAPDRFFIILSNQAHRPFLKVGGYGKAKRVVIKVRHT